MASPVLDAGARYTICLGCEHARELPVVGVQCGLCKCLMAAKTRFPSAVCPAGKW
jgi:hypothetical protein